MSDEIANKIENGPEQGEDLIFTKDPYQIKLERKIRNVKRTVWILGIFIAVNTIAALFIGQVYQRPSFDSGRSSITSAISNYKVNDLSSTTVYNQMVTNGWVAKDLLEAIGEQNATIIEQNTEANWMVGWLLFNILFTLGWLSIALIKLGLAHFEVQGDKHKF